jgi:hypothetical protein
MRESCDVCDEKGDNLNDGICNVCLTVAACHPDKRKRYSLSTQVNNRTKHRIRQLADAQKWKAR